MRGIEPLAKPVSARTIFGRPTVFFIARRVATKPGASEVLALRPVARITCVPSARKNHPTAWAL